LEVAKYDFYETRRENHNNGDHSLAKSLVSAKFLLKGTEAEVHGMGGYVVDCGEK